MDDKNTMISDTGISKDYRLPLRRFFTFLCNILTLALIILGILAWVY